MVSAAWLTSDGGSLGLVLANHQAAAEGPVTVVATLTTPTAWGAGRCCAVEPAGMAAKIDKSSGTVTVSHDLPSGAIDVVTLRPHDHGGAPSRVGAHRASATT